jgi:tripartite ATP-independent transporter DctP family solute receptor
MNSTSRTIGAALGLLLAASLIAGCDTKTSTRSTTRSATQNAQESVQAAPEPAPAPEPKVEAKIIKASVGLDERSTQYKGLLKFKELVESESRGRLKVELSTDIRQDGNLDMSYALQAGRLEMACLPTASFVRLDKGWTIFDLPFLFDNEDDADRVLDGALGRKYLDSLLAHGFVGMTFWENGFSQLTNGVRIVDSPRALKGLKIGTTGNPIHQATLKALGAKPVPIALDQRFASMYQKFTDGQESTTTASLLWKYHEAQRYITLTRHFYSPFVFVYGKRLWDTLDHEDQNVVFSAAQEAGRYQRQINRQTAKEALAGLAKAGMVVTDPGIQRHAVFVKAAAGVARQFEADFGAANLKALKDEIARKTH